MTYSIVARDPENGELGAAVQSRAFRAGAWATPGVGVVASQAYGERSYGPLGLELMRSGKTAEQTLAALRVADPLAEMRQVAMLAADGEVAVHTGSDCIPAAGHLPQFEQGERFVEAVVEFLTRGERRALKPGSPA